MAHPVRPESYMEINNFYTMTVYEKGAEVIRMLRTLLGNELFRKGTDLYFSRFDGHAATTDDFVAAMQSVSHIDLTQFKLWYTQAGTPELTIDWTYDEKQAVFTLFVSQYVPNTPGQIEKHPMHIPLRIALLSNDGPILETMLEIKQAQETFRFENIQAMPTLSLLRNFSAPVKIKMNYTDEQLLFIATKDTDAFCRWDAAQQLYQRTLLKRTKPDCLVRMIRHILNDKHQDIALCALMLQTPTQTDIASICDRIDVDEIYHSYEFLTQYLARELRDEWMDTYQNMLQTGPYLTTREHIAKRALKNTCLQYLVHNDLETVLQQFNLANNMTDSLAAMRALMRIDNAVQKSALNAFYQKWQSVCLSISTKIGSSSLIFVAVLLLAIGLFDSSISIISLLSSRLKIIAPG